MDINFQVTLSSITEDFVARCYEIAIDGTESEISSGGIAVPAPHNTLFDVLFTGLDKITHRVKLIGVTSGIIYSEFPINPKADIVTVFQPIRFVIGDGGPLTPAVGDSSYSNTILAGVDPEDIVWIRGGYGPVYEGIEIDNDTLGGFSLHIAGDKFVDKEEWVCIRKPDVVQTVVNDSVVGKQFGPTNGAPDMFVDVSSATNYGPLHLRKLIRLNGSAAVYTFTSGVVPPIGYVFRFSNFSSAGTTSPLPKVVFQNAPCLYGGATISEFSLSFRQVMEFCWDGTNWNITSTPAWMGSIPTFTKGVAFVGDVPGELTVNVPIPNQGNNTYFVTWEVKSNGTLTLDNRVISGLISKNNTSFNVWLREVNNGAQNISLDWCVINF